MTSRLVSHIARRDFLKVAGAAALSGLPRSSSAAQAGRVCLIVDSSSEPVKRAMERLRRELEAKGISCLAAATADAAAGASFCVVAAGPDSKLSQGFPRGAALVASESLRLSPGKVGAGPRAVPGVLVSGADDRGYVYGLLELAERVRFSSDPLA